MAVTGRIAGERLYPDVCL